jgi:hypothetical protein
MNYDYKTTNPGLQNVKRMPQTVTFPDRLFLYPGLRDFSLLAGSPMIIYDNESYS